MKSSTKLVALGKWLMQKNCLRILIADDESVYFTKRMIDAAHTAGYHGIERVSQIDDLKLQEILEFPPHVIILDVKGVCPPDVAKDGIELARLLVRETPSMIVITSAHHFHLHSTLTEIDYIIESRTLTSVDFINEISSIVDKYMKIKSKPYQNLLMKLGLKLARGALQSS